MSLPSDSRLPGRVIYVSPAGLSGNSGTAGNPLSLESGLRLLEPGSTLVFLPGEYPVREPLRIPTGEAERPVILRAEVPGSVWLEGGGREHPGIGATKAGIISIKDVSHVTVEGIGVRDSAWAGFSVRNARSIVLENCLSDGTYSCGIAVWHSHDVKVLGCEVTHANEIWRGLNPALYGEAPHEAISMASTADFLVEGCHIHDCDKEGIDVKETSRRGRVRRNWIHDISRQGIYVDAWFGLLEEIEVCENRVHDCQYGLVVSSEGEGEGIKVRTIHFHDNVVFRVSGSGFYFGTWGTNGRRENILLERNTFWRCGAPGHFAGPGGSIDLRSANFQDVVIRRNLCLEGRGFEIASPFGEDDQSIWTEKGLVIEENFLSPAKVIPWGKQLYGEVYSVEGKDCVRGTVELRDPWKGDLRPRGEFSYGARVGGDL